jgi:beta-glucanase (GH16 family)
MKKYNLAAVLLFAAISCQSPAEKKTSNTQSSVENVLSLNAAQLGAAEGANLSLAAGSFVDFNLDVKEAGRYRIDFKVKASEESSFWLEDYSTNSDERTYNITGSLKAAGLETSTTTLGSPLNVGKHPMRLHAKGGDLEIAEVIFTLLRRNKESPETHLQNMKGEEWELVWSDEFEGTGLPDTTKWSYNLGDWGWGNNEPQFYTEKRLQNARQEDGNLIIEAHKNDLGHEWTSARLSTQGKHSFTYGKIEFRAKVPHGRGTWAAGWLLGEAYRDELSWPYCGEIDVLECVGYEINDTTGHGLNHATCHTRAFYFKQGNQIGSEIEVDSMDTKFHTYGIEWHTDRIEAYLDGEHYFTYDKISNEWEWPFATPQNIILNLAVGGGWGGAQGIDPSYDSHQYIIDYVRVYQKTEME